MVYGNLLLFSFVSDHRLENVAAAIIIRAAEIPNAEVIPVPGIATTLNLSPHCVILDYQFRIL